MSMKPGGRIRFLGAITCLLGFALRSPISEMRSAVMRTLLLRRGLPVPSAMRALTISVEPALFCDRVMTVRNKKKQRNSIVLRRVDRLMESPVGDWRLLNVVRV